MGFSAHPARIRLAGVGLCLTTVCAQACGGGSAPPPPGSSGGTTGAATGGASSGGSPGVGGSATESGGQSSVGGSATGGEGSWGGAESGGAPGAGGSTQTSPFPSCAGMTGSECQADDCCASILVPGGPIQVDGADYELPSFHLDQYEVTVARFRKFQEVADAWQESGHPAEGEGAHPDVPESGWRTSWLEEFEESFAYGLKPRWRNYPESYVGGSEDPFTAGLPTYQVAGSDALAVNYVPVHIAFAFCIWDGGRLPAKAEWLYAASGGDTPTTYVWGNTPAPEEVFANLPEPAVPFPHAGENEAWDLLAIPVGSHPGSVGRFGHHDLVSGLGEYFRDMDPDEGEELGGLIELAGDEEIAGFSFSYWRAVVDTTWETPGVVHESRAVTPGAALLGFRCARDL